MKLTKHYGVYAFKRGYDQALEDVIYIITHKAKNQTLSIETLPELLESLKWVNEQ